MTYRAVEGAGHGFLGNATDSLVAEFFRALFLPATTAVGPAGPSELRLHATPNPTRGAVTISSSRAFAAADRVAILDVTGRTVRRLRPAAGVIGLSWDGRNDGGRLVPAGVYLIRHQSPEGGARLLRVAIVR